MNSDISIDVQSFKLESGKSALKRNEKIAYEVSYSRMKPR